MNHVDKFYWIIDRAILERTGAKVQLEPVTIKDLEIQIK